MTKLLMSFLLGFGVGGIFGVAISFKAVKDLSEEYGRMIKEFRERHDLP